MPYEKEQVANFRSQLNELMKKMIGELELLQVSCITFISFFTAYSRKEKRDGKA